MIFIDELRVWASHDGEAKAFIKGHTCWGVLRGLESFTQLVYSTKENNYMVT